MFERRVTHKWQFVIGFVFLLFQCGTSAAVSEAVLAEIRVSAESLVLAGCSQSDVSQIMARLDNAEQEIAALEVARDAHQAAVADRLNLFDQLHEADEAEHTALMSQLQAVTDDEAAKKLAYDQQIDSLRALLFAGLDTQLEQYLLTLRSSVSGLPLEYRILDWDARELRKLGRALKAQKAAESGNGRMTQQDVQVIQSAEEVYAVNLARQRLLVELVGVQALVDAVVSGG